MRRTSLSNSGLTPAVRRLARFTAGLALLLAMATVGPPTRALIVHRSGRIVTHATAARTVALQGDPAFAVQPVATTGGSAANQCASPAALVPRMTLPDAEARRLMDELLAPKPAAGHALERIATAHDPRFVAVLIEVLRAGQIGLLNVFDDDCVIRSLEGLSGQRLGADWPAWVEWYGSTTLTTPPGFTGWKGRLLARADLRFKEFLADNQPTRLRVEEIQWGGVKVDGIPALTNPVMIPAGSAAYLELHEPVFGIAINGDARAYPLRILDWHEMVNDVVGGTPISLSYCTLCGAGIAYDGRASDGATYTFGSSGLLYRSNKLMYDHETRTLWDQLTGKPLLGRLAGTSVHLALRGIVLTSWSAWRAEHPATTVLDIHTGYARSYFPGAAYGLYYTSPDTMFPVWRRSLILRPKARIYALQINGVPKAYPIDLVVSRRVIDDTLAGRPVVLVAMRGAVTAAGRHERGALDRVHAPDVTYSAGAEVRAYARGGEQFRPGPAPDAVLDEAGRVWRVTEDALVGPAGQRAPRVNGFLAYWFGWYSFFPQTLVYRP